MNNNSNECKKCCNCKYYMCLVNQGISWCARQHSAFFAEGVCEDFEETGTYSTYSTATNEPFFVDGSKYEDSDSFIKTLEDTQLVHEEQTIQCPYCGRSFYMELESTITAAYYPPIWKDGVNINPDKNTSKTRCQCMCCKEYFYIIDGKVQKPEK